MTGFDLVWTSAAFLIAAVITSFGGSVADQNSRWGLIFASFLFAAASLCFLLALIGGGHYK